MITGRWSSFRAFVLCASAIASTGARPNNKVRPPAAGVLVVPFEGRGLAWDEIQAATQSALLSVAEIPGHRAISAAEVRRLAGVDIAQEAQKCRHEIFCLVQLGEAAFAEKLVLATLMSETGSNRTLRILLLDVKRAELRDSLVWTFLPQELALAKVVPTAMRRLLSAPDAHIVLDVTPKEAKVLFYGEPVDGPLDHEIPYWSGTVDVSVSRDGYVSQHFAMEIPSGKATRIVIELQPDLLWVAPRETRRPDILRETPKSALLRESNETRSHSSWSPNVWALAVAAGGAAMLVIGERVQTGAYGNYATVANEIRYGPNVGHDAESAARVRDDAASNYRAGSWLLGAGIGVLSAGAAWFVVDAVLGEGADEENDPR